ncbi:MAG: hypothetical protein AAF387_13965 [Pseudomonadota bacterium]
MAVDRRRKSPTFEQIRTAKELALSARDYEEADRVNDALLTLSDALTLAEIELQKARTDADYWRQFNATDNNTNADCGSTNETEGLKARLNQMSHIMRTYYMYDVTAVFPQQIDEALVHLDKLYEAGKTLAFIIQSEQVPLTRKSREALAVFDSFTFDESRRPDEESD